MHIYRTEQNGAHSPNTNSAWIREEKHQQLGTIKYIINSIRTCENVIFYGKNIQI